MLLHTSQMKGMFIQQNQQQQLLIIALHFRAGLMDCSTLTLVCWAWHKIEGSSK